ncbi:MAG: type II toxin-antitoxin system VapC family toxin [Longimicrobiales bacterium]
MIVDTSAILAIVFREPGYETLLARLQDAHGAAVGSPTLAETGIVLHARLGDDSRGLLERLLDELAIQEIPFGEIHWREAVDAFRRFGKGRHPAGLNFGDCLTYAAAKLSGEALLYVGEDFSRTDLDRAIP